MQDALEARVEALEIAHALLAAKTFRLACYIADWADEEWIGFMAGHAGEMRRDGPEPIGRIADRIVERLAARAPGGGEEGSPPGADRAGAVTPDARGMG